MSIDCPSALRYTMSPVRLKRDVQRKESPPDHPYVPYRLDSCCSSSPRCLRGMSRAFPMKGSGGGPGGRWTRLRRARVSRKATVIATPSKSHVQGTDSSRNMAVSGRRQYEKRGGLYALRQAEEAIWSYVKCLMVFPGWPSWSLTLGNKPQRRF